MASEDEVSKPAPTTSSFEPGTGHLHLSAGPRARLSTLIASYPSKLLAPKPLPSQPSNVALVYTLAYGGGLVAGDCVQLRVLVDAGCTLVLLTQGSTKIYKQRAGLRPKSHGMSPALVKAITEGQPSPIVRQSMHVSVGEGGSLLLLPDALSPFKGSRYAQAQRVELAPGAGVVLLDWVNSGRGERTQKTAPRPWGEKQHINGEEEPVRETEVWTMGYYSSTNEIVVGDKVVARERMVLDNDKGKYMDGLSPTAQRLRPYHVYATVMIYGAPFVALRKHFAELVDQTSQFQLPLPPGLLWSYSATSEEGGILRVAGVEVEDVRVWLREAFALGGLSTLVGPGLWPRCI